MSSLKADKEHAVYLSPDETPTSWYNILPDLPEPLPPILNPQDMKPLEDPAPLLRLFAKELVMQEMSTERWIKIPDEVYDAYLRLPRPTPLVRAKRLEAHLKTPAEIYYKSEYLSPAGSHKPNTAIAQAYYNKALQAKSGRPQDPRMHQAPRNPVKRTEPN